MHILGVGTAQSSAPLELFYERWIDHSTWPTWSPDTEWVRMKTPTKQGASGTLKPRGGPAVRFFVSALTPPPHGEYTDTSRFPGARLVFQHTGSTVDGMTNLDVRVTMSGIFAPFWSRIMGKSFAHSAQADLDRLVTLVEAQHSSATTAPEVSAASASIPQASPTTNGTPS